MVLRRFLIIIGLAGLFGGVVVGHSQLVALRADKPWLLDFAKFHLSAQSLQSGSSIYRVVPIDFFGPLPEGVEPSREQLHPNLNMPVITLLFLPFGFTSVAQGMVAWTLFSFVSTIAAACLLGFQLSESHGLAGSHRFVFSCLLATFILGYFPTWANVALGQLGQVLLLVLCVAWLAARRGHDKLSGALFGLALALKPFTGVILLMLPWLGRWRLVRWYIGSFAALVLLGASVAGPDSYIQYLSALRAVNWYSSGWNASLMAPLSVLFGGGQEPGWIDYPWLSKLLLIACAALMYGLLVAQLRRVDNLTTRLDLAVAGAIPLMLLASPLGWIYYFPVMWIAAGATVEAVRPLPSRWIWWLSAATVLIFSAGPFPFMPAREAASSLDSLVTTSADTMALLIAFAFVLAAAWRVSGPRTYRVPPNEKGLAPVAPSP